MKISVDPVPGWCPEAATPFAQLPFAAVRSGLRPRPPGTLVVFSGHAIGTDDAIHQVGVARRQPTGGGLNARVNAASPIWSRCLMAAAVELREITQDSLRAVLDLAVEARRTIIAANAR